MGMVIRMSGQGSTVEGRRLHCFFCTGLTCNIPLHVDPFSTPDHPGLASGGAGKRSLLIWPLYGFT